MSLNSFVNFRYFRKRVISIQTKLLTDANIPGFTQVPYSPPPLIPDSKVFPEPEGKTECVGPNTIIPPGAILYKM